MFLIWGLSDVSLSLDSGYTFLAESCLDNLGFLSDSHIRRHSLVLTGDLILISQSRYCQFLHYMRIVFFLPYN